MVSLKYEEDNFSSEQKNKNTGLIIAIAVAILIVAAAAWFALSRYNSGNSLNDMVSDIKSNMGSIYEEGRSDINSMVSDITSDFHSVTSEIKSEYNDLTSSYDNIVSNNLSSATPTGDKVSSVPYSNNFSKPVEGEIVKKFSDSELIYSKTFGDMRIHNGIDILCKKGTSVSACGDGKVINIDESSQYGTVLTIELSNNLTAKYSSITDLKVKVGDTVKSGDIIGKTSTVPAECNDNEHLHFEVYKNSVAVDPYKALGL